MVFCWNFGFCLLVELHRAASLFKRHCVWCVLWNVICVIGLHSTDIRASWNASCLMCDWSCVMSDQLCVMLNEMNGALHSFNVHMKPPVLPLFRFYEYKRIPNDITTKIHEVNLQQTTYAHRSEEKKWHVNLIVWCFICAVWLFRRDV